MATGLTLNTIRSTETRTFNGAGCPTEWLLDSIGEYNGTPRQPRSFFERGTLGHAMIETHLKTPPFYGGDLDAAYDVLNDYVPPAGEWIETTKCTKDGLYEEVDAIFLKWLQQYREYYEELDCFDIELTLEFETPSGTKVSTTVDAIFRDENERPIVVDWKLGTSKSGADMQLYVYWYGMRRLGIAAPDDYFRGWFHYVNYSSPIQFTKSDGYPGDAFVEAYIDNAEKNRRHGPYLPNPSWMSCNYCEHQDWCPLFAPDAEACWDLIKETEVQFV